MKYVLTIETDGEEKAAEIAKKTKQVFETLPHLVTMSFSAVKPGVIVKTKHETAAERLIARIQSSVAEYRNEVKRDN